MQLNPDMSNLLTARYPPNVLVDQTSHVQRSYDVPWLYLGQVMGAFPVVAALCREHGQAERSPSPTVLVAHVKKVILRREYFLVSPSQARFEQRFYWSGQCAECGTAYWADCAAIQVRS